jgi:hypothetical protein
MSQNITIVIVEKSGNLKSLNVKEFDETALFKKCGFKKLEDFEKQTEWSISYDGNDYLINVYGKTKGRANNENKYDFPPPIDNTLFFGSCCIVLKRKISGIYMNLTLDIWAKIYEILFGGFEDLDATKHDDKADIDVLKFVSVDKLTSDGYLKDGFVVDDSDEDNNEYEYNDDDIDALCVDNPQCEEEIDEIFELQDIGSELSEESYLEEDDDDQK